MNSEGLLSIHGQHFGRIDVTVCLKENHVPTHRGRMEEEKKHFTLRQHLHMYICIVTEFAEDANL